MLTILSRTPWSAPAPLLDCVGALLAAGFWLALLPALLLAREADFWAPDELAFAPPVVLDGLLRAVAALPLLRAVAALPLLRALGALAPLFRELLDFGELLDFAAEPLLDPRPRLGELAAAEPEPAAAEPLDPLEDVRPRDAVRFRDPRSLETDMLRPPS
jgi:hypothetical protein